MKRRSFLAMTAGAGLLSMFGGAAQAVTADQARALVQQVSQQVIDLIKSPGSPQSKAPALKSILTQNFAVRDVAGFVLGRYARSTSPAQRDRYVQVYADYISRVYSSKFSEYAGQTIQVTTLQDLGSRGIYVNSQINSNGQLINVGWLVQDDRSGQPKITDINVDGLSMAESQRSEFTRMIAEMGGNVDAFIDRLQTLGA